MHPPALPGHTYYRVGKTHIPRAREPPEPTGSWETQTHDVLAPATVR